MKNVLVIGATSAIAEHCARRWALQGCGIYLTGRNEQRLQVIADDLVARGAAKVAIDCFDVTESARHVACLDDAQSALGAIDVVLIAHGTLPDQTACEQDVELAMREIDVNALSVIRLLTLAAARFEQRGAGTLAVISSVAGDRGRASNYVYGSAKAMVSAFASGLRQRLHKCGVSVVTIKPGFVDTPMTAAFDKGVLWAQPSAVSARIVRAIERKQDDVYVPSFWYLIMFVIRHVPTAIFKRLSL